jgi:hypothetical protein
MNTYRNIHPYFSQELEMEMPSPDSTIHAQNAELIKQLKAGIERLEKYDFHKFYFTQKHSHFSEDD